MKELEWLSERWHYKIQCSAVELQDSVNSLYKGKKIVFECAAGIEEEEDI